MTDWVEEYHEQKRQEQAEEDQKGGPGSGHHGHAGRPGKRGGSVPGKGGGGGEVKLSEPAQRTLTNLENDQAKVDGTNTLAELIRQHGPLNTMFEIRENGPVFEVHQTRDALFGFTGIAHSRHGTRKLAEGGRRKAIKERETMIARYVEPYVPKDVYWEDKETAAVEVVHYLTGS